MLPHLAAQPVSARAAGVVRHSPKARRRSGALIAIWSLILLEELRERTIAQAVWPLVLAALTHKRAVEHLEAER
jgi:hypothetical protein